MKHVSRLVTAQRSLIASIVGLVLLASTATPASAVGYIYTDSLDSATSYLWVTASSGPGSTAAVYTFDCLLARSACGGAILSQTGPGWASAGRPISLKASSDTSACTLKGHLQRRQYGSRPLPVNVEAIDPVTWNWLGVQTVYLSSPGSGLWDYLGTNFRLNHSRNVFIRFSVLGDNSGQPNVVNVDDVTVDCN